MQVARTAAQPWAKQSKLPPLVPEHKYVQTITAPASQLPQAAIRQRLSTDFTFQNVTVPVDSQLLRATPKPIKGGEDGDGLKEANTIKSTEEPIVQHAEPRWIPWKYRMTQSRMEDLAIYQRPKIPKIEGVQLHSLILDEPPSIEISNQGPRAWVHMPSGP